MEAEIPSEDKATFQLRASMSVAGGEGGAFAALGVWGLGWFPEFPTG